MSAAQRVSVALVPCGPTEWRAAGRLLGRVELPFEPEAESVCAAWAAALRPIAPARLYHSPDELAGETGRRIADLLEIPAKAREELAEVDFGLWAGLTEDDLAARYETAHRELIEAPLNVQPPEGEPLMAAFERLQHAVAKCRKSAGAGRSFVLVLRPVALALAHLALRGAADSATDAGGVWAVAAETDGPLVV